jgi:large subunit ribosomal protein L17
MRHNVAGRLFGRTANQRKALLRGLVASLIEHQRIETTLAKAKETRRIAEKLVTLGKRGDLHAKRLVMAKVPNRALVVKLFDEIAPRFADRNGGYLRIVPTRQRVNDKAQLAVLEFVDFEEIRDEATKGKKKEKAEKKAAPAKKEKAEKKAAPAKEEKAEKKAAPAKKKAEKESDSEKKTEKKVASAKKKAAKKTTSAKKKAAKKTTAKKKK